METVGVVLVAAGEGRRFGRAKAGLELAGRPLVERAAEAFSGFLHRVVVLREADLGVFSLHGWIEVAGGARRRDSVAAGLGALPENVARVLIHDAARPLADPDLVQRIAGAAGPAVVPAVAVVDTIKEVRDGVVVATPRRSSLVAVQTPQAFDLAVLRRALAASGADATDEASLIEALGEPVRTIPGNPANFKITTPLDLRLAEVVWATR